MRVMSLSPLLSLLCCLFLLSFSATAQLSVLAEQPGAKYEVGELMNFVILSNQSGTVDYTISYDEKLPALISGSVNVQAGTPKMIPYQSDVPCFVICKATQNNNNAVGGAAFSPEQIQPYEDAPSDFISFWTGELNKLAAIPIDPQLSLYSDNDYTKTYRINLATVEDRRVYGYLTIPDGDGPFPAVLVLPPYGNSPNVTSTSEYLAERGGAITLSISIHNVEVNQTDPNAYEPDVPTDRFQLYYKLAVLAAVRSIDYIFTRNDFDGQSLAVMGNSQGGGLALMTAGLDNRVKLMVSSIAAICEHTGFKYGRASGFPYYIHAANSNDDGQTVVEQTKYIDAVYFARRFRGPSLNFISYDDLVCPPATTYSAINQLTGKQVLVHNITRGHDNSTEYYTMQMAFFRRHFPAMQNPPWPWPETTVGYLVNAGSDKNTSANNPISLSASMEFNGQSNLDLPRMWEKVAGPGKVTFSDKNDYTTTANFSEPGEYTLRFQVTDDQLLESDDIRYTASDYIRVTVN